MKTQSSIGERMKAYYEKPYNIVLPMRMPVIIRLDGKGFHQLTKNMDKPFDNEFVEMMIAIGTYLVEEIQGAVFAYGQSDEISILLHNYKRLDSQGWFANEIQKMVSISAGLASGFFSKLVKKIVVFDSRVFVLPEVEVANYFIWRQQDATRNSIQMLARSLYSHKECYKKNTKQLQDMIVAKGKNWNDIETRFKRGWTVLDRSGSHLEPPIFTKDRDYIERFLKVENEDT